MPTPAWNTVKKGFLVAITIKVIGMARCLRVYDFLIDKDKRGRSFKSSSWRIFWSHFFVLLNYALIFSCDSSSISRNVGRSVGLSVHNAFYRSVMLLTVYLSCFYCCSLDY